MAESDYTITPDEWIVATLVTSVAPGADPVEAIETLRTLRTVVGAVATERGVTLDEPVGPERAARMMRDALPLIALEAEARR